MIYVKTTSLSYINATFYLRKPKHVIISALTMLQSYHQILILFSFEFQKFRMATSSGGSDDIFEDEYLLYSSSDTLNPSYWDCDGCPPPEFHLPPPPRPPWMEELDGCDKSEYTTLDDGRVTSSPSLKEILNSLDNTCDNTIVLNDSQSYFEDTFHSIAVIIVCSVVLVIMLLIIGVVIFR